MQSGRNHPRRRHHRAGRRLPGRFRARVFAEIVKLVAPYQVGREVFDTRALYVELCNITDYSSFQGGVRHVVSACEIKVGSLQIPQQPGLGARLTPEQEKYYSFREEAVYSCRPVPGRFPSANVWQN